MNFKLLTLFMFCILSLNILASGNSAGGSASSGSSGSQSAAGSSAEGGEGDDFAGMFDDEEDDADEISDSDVTDAVSEIQAGSDKVE
ncbi:hypothetical protein N9N67_11560 [Bacteriovoracaceae bacterium]|nr:hypothetical protein [Bacteriovoracaceae bacterium]